MTRVLVTGSCGYIGSAVYRHLEAAGHELLSVDCLARGNPGDIPNNINSYYYPAYDAAKFAPDVIIHLAGHSSVQACEADPWNSTENNLAGFLPFLCHLSFLPNPPLVLWASSGSVLSDVHSLYDEQKRALEALVPRLYPRSIGLRFASVCGVSPNMRDDLILNAMVKSAVTKGYLTVANPFISKPILGLKDLCISVEGYALFGDDVLNPSRLPWASMYDLASFVCSPEQAAFAVKSATGCDIRRTEASRAYSFDMEVYPNHKETLDSIIADLVAYYRERSPASDKCMVEPDTQGINRA